jgi:CMP-N-acetylneuraminic acid synthetase
VFLAVVPARGGSKGIPHKNLQPLRGIPLIQHTLIAAHMSDLLDDVIVTTDDNEIAQACEGWGDVIMRPPELAQDDTPMLPVVQHAVATYGKPVDAVVLLQPTSPLRDHKDIDAAIKLWNETPNADSLVSVCLGVHPKKSYVLMNGVMVPFARQVPYDKHKDRCLTRNGAIFITSRHLLDEGRLFSESSLFYVMPRWKSLDLDYPEDVFMAEAIMKHRSETQREPSV